jgi:hypothetical protein
VLLNENSPAEGEGVAKKNDSKGTFRFLITGFLITESFGIDAILYWIACPVRNPMSQWYFEATKPFIKLSEVGGGWTFRYVV